MPNVEYWPVHPATPLIGTLYGLIFAVGIIGVIYFINRFVRRRMKATGDDARIEQDIEAGNTLHAEGIYGRRHPEEGGLPLEQEQPHTHRSRGSLNDQPSP